MSKLVDERVVEMRFDNSNFERNTRQSMSTISKLKASLNFSGVAASLNKSVSSIDLGPITAGLAKAGNSFSAWEIASITAISNVTNRVVDLGIQLIKSLSVDNIAAGWEKFTEQTKNTGTIINQLSNKMSELEAANITEEYMQKLQWYADATSYSLTDMTSAISKFIGKGKDMDESFKASVGIANWAATAGKNAQEAQVAFNALSKVADHVLSRQWTSIELGTMDTIEFKKAVLEAAVAQGELTESAQRYDGVIEYITKKGNTVTTENFTEFFSDEWFNIDVLMKVLGNYGYAVDEVMDLNKKMEKESGKEVTPYSALEEYIKQQTTLAETYRATGEQEKLATAELALFSAKALTAASEARTLEDAINAVKDAVSTGWLTAFQKIIGTYRDATDFFSDFADELTNIFTAPTKALNNVLNADYNEGFRNILFGKEETKENEEGVKEIVQAQGALWNLFAAINGVIKTVRQAWSEVFPFNKSLKEISESLRNITAKMIMSEETAKNVKGIFKGVFSIFKLGIKILQGLKIAIDPIIKAILGDSKGIIQFFGELGEKFSKWVSETQFFIKIGSRVGNAIASIIDKLKEVHIIDNIITSFKKFKNEIMASEMVKDAINSIKESFTTLFELIVRGIRGVLQFSAKYIIPVVTNIIKYLIVLVGVIAGAVVKGVQLLIQTFKKFVDYIRSSATIQAAWKQFIEYLKSIPGKLKKLGPFFTKLGKAIGNFFNALWSGIVKLGTGLAEMLRLHTIGELFAAIGDKISTACGKIANGIKSLSSIDVANTEHSLSPLQTLFKGLLDLFRGIWTVFKALIPLIGKILSNIGRLLEGLGNSINKTFNKDVSDGKGINLWGFINGTVVTAGILYAVKKLYDFFWLFMGITSSIADVFSALAFKIRANSIKQWAEAIKMVAQAILMVVASIFLISMMDEAALKKSVSVLISIMVVMGLVIAAMGKFLKSASDSSLSINKKGLAINNKNSGFFGVAAMIMAYGAAIAMLVVALKIVDTINKDKILTDLAILFAIMGAFAIAMGVMNAFANAGNKTKSPAKGIKGMVSFALGLLILLIPIKKMSEMPLDKLQYSILGITAIMLSYAAMVRIMNGVKAKGVTKMAAFAAGVAALVVPIQMLGSLDNNILLKGVAAVSAIGFTYGMVAVMAKNLKIGSALALTAIMAAFGFLIVSIVDLINGPITTMSKESIGRFILITGSILAFLTVLMITLSKISGKTKQAKKTQKNTLKTLAMFAVILASLSFTALSLVHLSRTLDTIQWDKVASEILMLVSIMGITMAAMEYSKLIVKKGVSYKSVFKKLSVLAAVAGAIIATMYALAGVGLIMNNVGWDSILKSILMLSTVASLTVGLMSFLKLLKPDKDMAVGMLMMSSIIAAMSTMMLGLAALTQVAKTTDLATVGKVLLLIGGTLMMAILTVVAASKFNKQLTKVSLSLLQLGAAFALFGASSILFAVGLKLLQSCIPGLIIFAGIVVVLGVAMKLLGAGVPTMLTIAVAFGVMGLAALAIGAAFYLIVKSLQELLPVLDDLAQKSDSLTTVLSAMVQGVIEGIAKAIPVVTEYVLQGLDTLIQYLLEKIHGILEFIKKLNIKDVLDVIEPLLNLAMSVIIMVLSKIAANIGTIVDKLIDILLNTIYALIRRIPELLQALVDLVLALIDGFGQTIEDNAARIRDAMINFCKHLWNAFLNFFGIHSPSKKTEEAGKNIIQGIIQGIGKTLSSVIKTVVDVGKKMLKEITKLPKEFMKQGVEIFKSFLNGLKSVVQLVLNFIKDVWNKIKNFFGIGTNDKQDFKNAGKETLLSYKEGMESADMDVNKTAKEVIASTINELSKTDIFKMIGKEIADNIADGLSSNSGVISAALKEVLQDITFEIQDEYEDLDDNEYLLGYMNKILDVIENGIDDEDLTIRPVMDLSDIQNGTGLIAAMLSSVGGITVAKASANAEKVSTEMASAKMAEEANNVTTTQTQMTSGEGEVYNVTFNITGNDPQAIADEVSKRFQQEVSRRNLKWA